MKKYIAPCVVSALIALSGGLSAGCREKSSRSVTFEGPEKKYELEVSKTDKDADDDD